MTGVSPDVHCSRSETVSDERNSRGSAKAAARSGGRGNMLRLWRGNGHYSYQADIVQPGPGAPDARMWEMRLDQNTNHQIKLKISRSPDHSRFDLPLSVAAGLIRVPKSGLLSVDFGPCYWTEILTVRRQSSAPSATLGCHAKELKMAFGRRIPSVKEEPHASKPLCLRCSGTGRVSERGGRVVCKLCKGTGKVLPAPEPVRVHPFS
jgi:hypothetical protein